LLIFVYFYIKWFVSFHFLAFLFSLISVKESYFFSLVDYDEEKKQKKKKKKKKRKKKERREEVEEVRRKEEDI
jgi:hypothetical protein